MSILRNFNDSSLIAGFGFDFILTNCFSFLFIHVYNAARLFWILLLFELFLVILGAPLYLLLLNQNSPSPRGVSAATHVGTDVSNFRKPITL